MKRWLALCLMLGGLSVFAADAPKSTEPVLLVTGDVGVELKLNLDDLRAMPRTTIQAKDHNGDDHTYEGVLCSELLKKAKVPLGEDMRGPALSTYIIVKAVDNYQVIFSIAELDPAMNEHPMLVADRTDGRNVMYYQGPIRLVATGDKRFARWVRQVKEIRVVHLEPPPKPVPQ